MIALSTTSRGGLSSRRPGRQTPYTRLTSRIGNRKLARCAALRRVALLIALLPALAAAARGDLLDLGGGAGIEEGSAAATAWREAEALLAGGDLPAALAAFGKVRIAGALPPAALLRQAQILAVEGRWAEALERCAALPLDDGSTAALAGTRLRARLLAATGRWGEAAAAMAALLDTGRLAEDPAAWLELARWLERAGDRAEARERWAAAGAKGIWPLLSDLERARLQSEQGDLEGAAASWGAALLADPDCQEALAGLVRCQLAAAARRGEAREAEHAAEARLLQERVRQLEPWDADRMGGWANDLARQLAEADAAIGSAPLRADAWLRLAELSLAAGRWWRAREALWMADSLALTDPRPAWRQAQELARAEEWRGAADALERAARLHPAGSEVWMLLAQARARTGEAAGASAAWAAAAALLPWELPVIRSWRDAAYAGDDAAAACRAARRVVRLAGASADDWLRLGDVERRRGALEPAEFAYRKVLELAGDAAPPMVYFRLSQTLQGRGEAAASAAMLERWRALKSAASSDFGLAWPLFQW